MMEIKLLKKEVLKSEELYNDFINGTLNDKEEYFSDDVVHIKEAPDFPIYMGVGIDDKENDFMKAFDVIAKYYINTDRDVHFEGLFWYSLLCTKKRDFLLSKYPKINESQKDFNNIVLKKFDWENYIYKCVLGAQYIVDNLDDEEERNKYFRLIVENLDVYNYIIKYEIFRNDRFLINILDIINDNDLSKVMKKKIKDRDDLGKDERVGRRVIFEFNKSYPVVISPAMDKEELEELFIEYLKMYDDSF